MKQTFILILIFIFNFTFSQKKLESDFRSLNGVVEDKIGPLPGQNVRIKGTQIVTQTDFDGKFCLVIPTDKTVFIDLPFCFNVVCREIKPTENNVSVKIFKDKESKKVLKKWEKVKESLVIELEKLYQNVSYEELRSFICR